jgi:hypothetical protein
VLEFEQLLKVFLAENGTKADILATLAATQQWARARCAESLAIGERYLESAGPFPQRLPELQLTSRFITDFYLLVLNLSPLGGQLGRTWPEDLRRATPDPAVLAQTVERARRGIRGEAVLPEV